MENNCLNCGQEITGNYCSNCGQKKYRRIDRKYIIEEAQYSLLHTNKGFLYSVKNILKNPGKTAREFIDGNRVNHYKPILLAFVLSGISAIISFKIIGLNEIMKDMYASKNMDSGFADAYVSITSTYFSFLMLACVPVFALFTKLAFYKWGQNYYEHVVMNAFTVSFYTIVSIIFLYPFYYIFRENFDQFQLVLFSSMLTIPIMLVWFYKGFYSEKALSSILVRILLISILTAIAFTLVVFILIVVYFTLYPEAIQQMQQQKT